MNITNKQANRRKIKTVVVRLQTGASTDVRASWPWKDSFVFVQKLPEPLAKQSQLFQTIMTACCVSGCKNRYSSQCEIKFHRIPSTWGPFRANRRRLWIKAIEEANGSVLQLKPNICICGAHFISGKCINRFFFIKQLAGSLTEYLFLA